MGRTLARWACLGAAALAAVLACMSEGSDDNYTADGHGWPDVRSDGSADASSEGSPDRVGADADADGDARADSSWESWDPDSSPDGGADDGTAAESAADTWEAYEASPEAVEDVPDVGDSVLLDVCAPVIEEPQVYYLSADDSNSQASPVIARWLIRSGNLVPASLVRTWEFLNYYDVRYDFPARGHVNVVPQLLDLPGDDGRVAFQIGVQGHEQTDETRRRLSLTLSLDTSGSMAGTPLEYEKAVVRALASSLRFGDTVSVVTWNDSRTVALDSHPVSGPDDATLLAVADALVSGGRTNLDAGLDLAYELAVANRRPGTLNRVVLISDGQANVGVTSPPLIARHAEGAEEDGIYLVGVGTGNGYDDTLMDTVTDLGKGAYVFIDSTAEARRQFVDHFYANMELAVADVRVELTLPPQLRMQEFHGEEISTDPEEVDPQHLAPNDAMIFHQYLYRCPGLADEDPIRVVAEYTSLQTHARQTDAVDTSLEALQAGSRMQLYKGNAIVVYAEGLKSIYDLLRYSGYAAARAECDRVRAEVRTAADILDDQELDDILLLMTSYCADLSSRREP
ncbi:MAG: VWA domain-containing protein [Deltaproteobacteria bacterium]|nr:VWA domain-containing protein [Deltaproteobacteria bacterium]